jgi:hypothetical protein
MEDSMTYIVRVTNPALANPEPREFDIDQWWDWEELQQLLTGTMDVSGIAHLYEGEKIVIECVKRDDSSVSEERRDAFA